MLLRDRNDGEKVLSPPTLMAAAFWDQYRPHEKQIGVLVESTRVDDILLGHQTKGLIPPSSCLTLDIKRIAHDRPMKFSTIWQMSISFQSVVDTDRSLKLDSFRLDSYDMGS